jgi:HAD superfamily hydrolase (TIGR01549 family)
MFKAIVFDYNGTLVDDLDLVVESYHRAGAEQGFDLKPATVRQHISQPPSRKRLLYYGDISDAEWERILERRKQIYTELAASGFKLFPHTKTALTALSHKYLLGVLSNTFRDLFERLFPPHLAKLMTATLFFEEVPDPKPSPAPMVSMLSILGVEKHQCCYVGDAVEDVQMAKAAGVRAYAITTGACSCDELYLAGADWVAEDLKSFSDRLLSAAA